MKRTKTWHLECCMELLWRAMEQADLANEKNLAEAIHVTRIAAINRMVNARDRKAKTRQK